MTSLARLGGTRLLPSALVAVAVCVLVMGCTEGEQSSPAVTPAPAAAYTGPGSVRAVMDGTQMHLEGVGVGVGNIWEAEYVTEDGTRKRGPTAGLWISVEEDTSQNRHLRVHDGFDVNVPGYRLHVVSVGESSVEIAVIKLPE
jgi:hypothetical protein